METQCKLTEIPEALHLLINDRNRKVQLFAQKGEIKSINVMRGIYRVYLKSSNGSGEHRYTPEEAAEITVMCA